MHSTKLEPVAEPPLTDDEKLLVATCQIAGLPIQIVYGRKKPYRVKVPWQCIMTPKRYGQIPPAVRRYACTLKFSTAKDALWGIQSLKPIPN